MVWGLRELPICRESLFSFPQSNLVSKCLSLRRGGLASVSSHCPSAPSLVTADGYVQVEVLSVLFKPPYSPIPGLMS